MKLSETEDDDPRLPVKPNRAMRELEFFEKVVALAKRYDVLVAMTWPMPISSTMAGKRRQLCGTGCTRCGSRVLYAVEKLQQAGWRIGFMVGNKTLVSALAQSKAITITALLRRCRWRRLRTRGRSTVRARHCRTVQTPPCVLVKGLHEAGWMVEMPKASSMSGRKSRNHMRPWDRWNLPEAP